VKVHRAHAMRKLRVRTLADLVRMIEHCETQVTLK
jgi:FixJ family two-component response regulator